MALNIALANLPIKPHARRRYLALVYHQGNFEIRCPLKTPKHTIRSWLLENQSEILALMKAKEATVQPRFAQFGEQGHYHLNGEQFAFNESLTELQQGKWLQRQMQQEYDKWLNWIELCADKIGLRHAFAGLNLRKTKSKWGHCSVSGKIQLNWQLAGAPEAVQYYVVVHEVCHLRHMNHSREFWALVATLDEHYQQHRQWLKQQGYRLVW